MIRYSGDTEIEIKYNRRLGEYVGIVKDPFLRFEIIVPAVPRSRDPETTARNHDKAARRLLGQAMRWARRQRRQFLLDRSGTRIRIRRVYQAPCPLE